jgi:uncharacterized protein (DUF779 family)
MKRTIFLTALIASLVFVVVAQTGSEYFPKGDGAVCDRKDKMCWDHEGLSVGITKMEFGEEAANKVVEIFRDKSFNSKVFTLRSGVHCDCNIAVCYKSKYSKKVNHVYTDKLFKNVE